MGIRVQRPETLGRKRVQAPKTLPQAREHGVCHARAQSAALGMALHHADTHLVLTTRERSDLRSPGAVVTLRNDPA